MLSTYTHRHSRLLCQSICGQEKMEFSGYLQISTIPCSIMLYFLLYSIDVPLYSHVGNEGSTPPPGHIVTDCSGISVGDISG